MKITAARLIEGALFATLITGGAAMVYGLAGFAAALDAAGAQRAAATAEEATEADTIARLCDGWQTEARTPSGARVDCLSASFAVEVDWTENWAEAIGQSLHYAADLQLEPGIILVCRQAEDLCLGHAQRLDQTVTAWELPISVWRCPVEAATLDDCRSMVAPLDPSEWLEAMGGFR